MTASHDGRRVIVAPVTGEIGERIQTWREKHDPQQARRLPPHATMVYWANVEDSPALDAQVHHAFPGPIRVQLGEVHTFDNPDHTLYINVSDHQELDASRARVFDGSHFTFPEQRHEWDWHVTVVRYGIKADLDSIRPALPDLALHSTWTIDTLLWLELRDGVYREARRWELG